MKSNYIKQGKVDGYFKEYFKNAEPDQQLEMKKTIIEKNKQ